jgi:hypothetical protein
METTVSTGREPGSDVRQCFVCIETSAAWLLKNRMQRAGDHRRPRPPRHRNIQKKMASSIGRKYMLSRKYYEFVDRKGVYTRKRGLDCETNKQLLLKYIRDNRDKNKPDMMDNDPLKILSIKEQIKI